MVRFADDFVLGFSNYEDGDTLDFGHVAADSGSARMRLVLANQGMDTLEVTPIYGCDFDLSMDHGTSLDSNQTLLINNGEPVEFEITFSPADSASVQDSLIIRTNDPSQSDFIIKLTGIAHGFTSIDNLMTGDVRFYPNPARDVVQIVAASQVSVELYNMAGIKVQQKEAIPGKGAINVSKLKTGVYLIKISRRKQQFINKLIVK